MMNLLNRLTVKGKLSVLGILVFFAVGVPLFLQLKQSQELIVAAEAEVVGIVQARDLVKLMQLTQQHRALLAAPADSGSDGARGAIATNESEMDGAVSRLDADLVAQDKSLAASWKQVGGEWRSLKAESMPGDSASRHAALVAGEFKLLDEILDLNGVILDPRIDTHYLATGALSRLPMAVEALVNARDFGAAALAAGPVTPKEQASLADLLVQMREQSRGTSTAFEKAFAANEDLRAHLQAQVKQVQAHTAAALIMAGDLIAADDGRPLPAAEFGKSLTSAIDAFATLESASLDRLAGMLGDRVHDLKTTEYLQFTLLALLVATIAILARAVTLNITRRLGQAVDSAQRIARGDLTGDVQAHGRDELAKLLEALGTMRASLGTIVGEVRGDAEGVAVASTQISLGSSDLSHRTEQQAASLEETASTMEEIASTVRLNAEHAQAASRLAREASDLARHSGDSVSDVVQTMKQIDASSRQISDIIGVIDGIAFQTNILALNAAVEAARAGEQGRGFAVVATEVRGLARRSADAAKEIKGLIATSVDHVNSGCERVETTQRSMHDAVQAIGRVAEAVAHIANASMEQSKGVGQVNDGVAHLDELTQQNAALVEESAAAARSLTEQAARLSSLVNTFRVAAQD